MIRITDKSKCCGCTACMNACPVQCIVMRRDREGFDYPVANPDLCVGCGKCESVCPVLNPLPEVAPLASFAARCVTHVEDSSSGGVFPALAEKFLDKGGLVYGAAVMEDMIVGHVDVRCRSDLGKLKGSKYVQSDLYAVFEEIRDSLEAGEKVMFSGTPCQVSGLHKYLDGKEDGLVTVDVACHGVPSPGLWEKYVAALGRKYEGKVCAVSFRDKTEGWRRYGFKVDVCDETGVKTHVTRNVSNPYVALFLQDMTLRPSCYACPSRNGRSGSDLTLADLWSVAKSAPDLDDDRGASLVIVNTQHGQEMLDSVRDGLLVLPVDTESAKTDNGGFALHIDVPERRDEFFKGLHSSKDIIRYMRTFVVRRYGMKELYKNVHTLLSNIKRRIRR